MPYIYTCPMHIILYIYIKTSYIQMHRAAAACIYLYIMCIYIYIIHTRAAKIMGGISHP